MKISVVIPLYNKNTTINEALQSVIRQAVQPFEIIVVNDGSTDGSDLVVGKINHPLIRMVYQSNQGVSAARNRGIEEAEGDWIAFLDADDKWLPEYLETILDLKAKYPECSAIATAYFLSDPPYDPIKIKLNKLPFSGKSGLLTNYFEVASHSHPPVCSDSIVVKKTAINSIGGFPSGIKAGEDLLTWARLAAKFDIAYSKKPLSEINQTSAHTYYDKPSRIPEKPDLVGKELISMAKNYANNTGIRRYVAHWFKMRSSIYLRLGMRRNALNEILKSMRYNPLNLKIYVYLILLLVPSLTINNIFRRFGNP